MVQVSQLLLEQVEQVEQVLKLEDLPVMILCFLLSLQPQAEAEEEREMVRDLREVQAEEQD
jgi:hypothetical protein